MVTQVIKNQIGMIESRERKIFWVFFSILFILIISYGFLLNSTMINGVSKQSMEKEITSLSSDVNSMEFQYLNIKNSITIALAQSKGFVSVPSSKFAIINSTKNDLSLSINEN